MKRGLSGRAGQHPQRLRGWLEGPEQGAWPVLRLREARLGAATHQEGLTWLQPGSHARGASTWLPVSAPGWGAEGGGRAEA